jgi:hypothetical protein
MNPMINPWKLATIGLLLVGFTALTTGVTTAYFMRPGVEPAPAPVTAAPAFAPAPPAAPAARYVAARPAAAPAARVVRTAAVPVATTDCGTTGDRVWRIAKPGAIGGLLGAGVGAAGGAIVNGGKAAGKGALLGGLAGALLGGGYGAYKTKQECGTVFGSTSGGNFPLFSAR